MSHFLRFLSAFEVARPDFGESSRQKWNISPVFCLLSSLRAPILESPVDKKEAFPPFFVYFRFRTPRFWRVRYTKKSHFLRFLSTFEVARAEFGVGGRQKWVISSVFCLLSRSRALNFDQPVDKNHTFIPFFVCFPFELQSGLRAKNRFSNFARKLLMQHGNSTRSRHRLLPLHCIFHADKELRQKQIIHASPKMQWHPHQKAQSIFWYFKNIERWHIKDGRV